MDYLEGVKKQMSYYRMLGEQTMEQLPDTALFWQYNSESNSIAIIVKHLHGNMMSRWTDFLNSDGEKEWRHRDDEFLSDLTTREQVVALWNEGWDALEHAINSLTEEDLEKTVYIRNQGHSVVDAINRQLAHYPYHVGQIVFIGKMVLDNVWRNLSIARGKSAEFNTDKFAEVKNDAHFTDEFLKVKSQRSK